MKLAVTGKGGVGKSTLVAMMARVLRDAGKKVLAVDADPDMNLAAILNVPDSEKITPIIEMKEMIAERTGTEVDKPAPFFKMNPKVDDIPDKYCIDFEGIKLLVMGTVRKGGGGCACPENNFLKTLITHLVISGEEWVLLDMEAGIEHLGRGTALGVDHMLVVVEPSRASTDTALRIQELSEDIKIKKVSVIGNKIQVSEEEQFIRDHINGIQLSGVIPQSEEIRKINVGASTIMELDEKTLAPVKALLTTLSGEQF
jgi:CO dehydrogenase maturation factor